MHACFVSCCFAHAACMAPGRPLLMHFTLPFQLPRFADKLSLRFPYCLQVYQLLTMNYVEDDEAMFRFDPTSQCHASIGITAQLSKKAMDTMGRTPEVVRKSEPQHLHLRVNVRFTSHAEQKSHCPSLQSRLLS